MNMKPERVFLIVVGLGLLCTLTIQVAAAVTGYKGLYRVGLIVFSVTFGVASLPLVGSLVYSAIQWFKRTFCSRKKQR